MREEVKPAGACSRSILPRAQALRAAGQPVVAGLVLHSGAPRAPATAGGAQSLAPAAVAKGLAALLRMALPRDLSCQTTATCRDGWGPTSLRTEWTEGRLALETVPQLLAVLTQLALGLLLLLKPRLLANVLRRPQAAPVLPSDTGARGDIH